MQSQNGRYILIQARKKAEFPMTFAVSVEQTGHQAVSAFPGAFRRRLIILGSLIASDLACFVLADLLLRISSVMPSIAVLNGAVFGRPDTAFDLMSVLALAFVSARYLVGDYSRRQLFWDGARNTTNALLLCAMVYIGVMLIVEPHGLFHVVLMWFGLLFLVPSARQLTRRLLGDVWHLPTAIVGTSETVQEVCPALSDQTSLGLRVQWIVPGNTEQILLAVFSGLSVLYASPETLVAALSAVGCRQIILAPDDQDLRDWGDLVDQLVGADIGVAIVPSLRRLPLYGLSTDYFFGKDLLLLQVRNNLARLPQRILKRSIDLIVSAILLAVLSPLFLVLAVLIKLEDGGPVFFVQTRVGRRGVDFNCWKFRTMSVDAEAQLARWETENPKLLARYRECNFKLRTDPRVTRIGAWVRRNSLDELPQLINVLRGDMSLIGPRPLLRRELPDYGNVIALYERVRPGITGLWQISGRSHTTFAERVSYDEWYIKNWALWYDIVIVLRTVRVLLQGEGAY